MTDFSMAVKSNSDQLNSGDLIKPRIIKITKIIDKQATDKKQPIWISYEGDCGSPYKPSLGMRKIILSVWGDGQHMDTEPCIGRLLELYNEPSVVYAGKEAGGIRICGMSDIDGGFSAKIKVNRTKNADVKVRLLEHQELAPYPEEKFNGAFDAMVGQIDSGKMTLQGVIARLQETGPLTDAQLSRLKNAAPIDENEDNSGVAE